MRIGSNLGQLIEWSCISNIEGFNKVVMW